MFGWLFSWTLWKCLIILNALLGTYLLRKTLKKLEKHRTIDEPRDAKFPQWRRHDSQNMNHWSMYIGAATMMIPRILMFLSVLAIGVPSSYLCFFGMNIKSGDIIQGPRKNMSDHFYHYGALLLTYSIGLIPDIRRPTDCDYSRWLGPGYEHIKTPSGWPGCIVSNHMGFMDINII